MAWQKLQFRSKFKDTNILDTVNHLIALKQPIGVKELTEAAYSTNGDSAMFSDAMKNIETAINRLMLRGRVIRVVEGKVTRYKVSPASSKPWGFKHMATRRSRVNNYKVG